MDICDLTRRWELTREMADQLRALAARLTSDPTAPTAIRSGDRVLRDHLADSLVALELASVRMADAIADIGSGAGIPGLALAIARPGARLALIESSARKCDFIARAVVACGLTNVEVVHARVEEVGRRESFDLVTARALAPLVVVAEYAAPLLKIGGCLVVWRGRREVEDENAADAAAGLLGLTADEVRRVDPYAGARERHLHVLRKVSETPERFPRRPGIARKRPLVCA